MISILQMTANIIESQESLCLLSHLIDQENSSAFITNLCIRVKKKKLKYMFDSAPPPACPSFFYLSKWQPSKSQYLGQKLWQHP